MTIIIDASVLCAFANKKDVHHETARAIVQNILHGNFGRPVITDYIFDEIVGVITRKVGRQEAVSVGDALLASEIVLHYVHSAVFQNAWTVFTHSEKLSFTDCTIVAFMKLAGITKVATFDKEFRGIQGVEVVG